MPYTEEDLEALRALPASEREAYVNGLPPGEIIELAAALNVSRRGGGSVISRILRALEPAPTGTGVLPVAQGRSRGELMDELLTWEVVQASPQGLERATDDELARYLSYLKSTIGKSARERLAFSDWQRSTA